MNEPPGDTGPAAPAFAPGHPAPAARRSASRVLALAAGAAVLLLIAAVATAPFWAEGLPWAPETPPPAGVVARIDGIAAAVQRAAQQARRDSAAARAAIEQLEKRIGALEARPAPAAPDLSAIRDQVAKLASAVDGVDGRLSTLDKAMRGRATEGNDAALVMALLRLRETVAAGRPFTVEYEALKALARGRPEIAAAAAPLAEPAKAGVSTRAALADGLRELSARLNDRAANVAPGSWTAAALSRLGGLVTIRRADDNGKPPPGRPAGPVDQAERTLAGGDLPGALTAVGGLTGTAAAAAQPWLREARQRLAVEAALQHLEAQLLTKLGGAPPVPGPPN